MRGLSGAKVEIGLATMAYNLKRITNVLGATKVTEALHHALIERSNQTQIQNPERFRESICFAPLRSPDLSFETTSFLPATPAHCNGNNEVRSHALRAQQGNQAFLRAECTGPSVSMSTA
jgi:hypothetical protein